MKAPHYLSDYTLDYESYYDPAKGREVYRMYYVLDGRWHFLHGNVSYPEARELAKLPYEKAYHYVRGKRREYRLSVILAIAVFVLLLILLLR